MSICMWPYSGDNSKAEYVPVLVRSLEATGAKVYPHRIATLLQGADAFHLHWLEAVFWGRGKRLSFAAVLTLISVLVKASLVKLAGGRVVWTVHNSEPHDKLRLDQWLCYTLLKWCVVRLADSIISLADPSANEMLHLPAAAHGRLVQIPHPHYRQAYADFAGEGATLRAAYGIPESAFVAGVIGQVRPYKGVVDIIRLFSEVAREDEYLVIAGKVDGIELKRELLEASSLGSRCMVIDRWLDDHEYAELHALFDVVIFNYEKILNSGSVIAALSLERRCLAPAMGAVEELTREVGRAWCETFRPPLMHSALRTWLDTCRKGAPPTGGPNLDELEPRRVAAAHLLVYKSEA